VEAEDRVRVMVMVVDDHPVWRDGVRADLEASGRVEVVAEAADGGDAIELAREAMPELVLMDLNLPTVPGVEAIRRIVEESPHVLVLVLSASGEEADVLEAVKVGASGYLLKSRVTDVDEFIETLERIVKGGSVVDPVLVQELVAARRVEDPLEVLSPREREVLSLMAEGRSNAGIARQIWVTEGTVAKHIQSILMKLDLAETSDDHRRVLAVLTYLERR